MLPIAAAIDVRLIRAQLKCSPDNCHPACVQTWETMRHLQFVWSFYGNLDREMMIENDIMELWGTYSYCTYLQTHPKKTQICGSTWPVMRTELRKTNLKQQTVAKWAHFYFKSMMQYSSHCLFHHITHCLVLPLCERVPYESPTKVIPNILAFR